MNHFATGVPGDLVEECRASMVYNNMDLSRFMVHYQQVEESRLKRKNREVKRASLYEGGISKGKFDIQDKPKFKKRFSNQAPPNFSKARKDWVSKPRPQGGKVVIHKMRNQIVPNVVRNIWLNSLVGTDNYFGCGKRGHMVRDCPMSKTQGRDINKAQASGLNYDSHEKNHFYALQSRDDQEDSLDVVTGQE
ncbi:uncharacterized protein LOC107016520 [Solanum pennellii]|uniref:Uncharacterized protein LOC107016520 n=1 Tax=Solanum pennellii TaxID=28526 RepID=A0ABM1GKR9_SOLPN|nr:uncharacterized protein LOC107016520 [Solanum pennellii]